MIFKVKNGQRSVTSCPSRYVPRGRFLVHRVRRHPPAPATAGLSLCVLGLSRPLRHPVRVSDTRVLLFFRCKPHQVGGSNYLWREATAQDPPAPRARAGHVPGALWPWQPIRAWLWTGHVLCGPLPHLVLTRLRRPAGKPRTLGTRWPGLLRRPTELMPSASQQLSVRLAFLHAGEQSQGWLVNGIKH